MLRNWKILGQAISVGAMVFVFAWVAVFLVNVISVQREMVSSPPFIDIEMQSQPYTIAVQPGMVITPQSLLDRNQYEIDIKNTSNKLDISPLDLRFQFPYNVEDPAEIKSIDKDGDVITFRPDAPKSSFSGLGTISVYGAPSTWRNYWFHASRLSPMGTIKLIVRLNGKLDPRATSRPEGYTGPTRMPHEDHLFVAGYYSFSMGGQELKQAYYAPMFLDEKRMLFIGYGEHVIPQDLPMDFQLQP